MVIMVLMSILIGSFSTMGVLLVQDASWGIAALGYVAGGWAGALLAVALLVARSRLSSWMRGMDLHPARDRLS